MQKTSLCFSTIWNQRVTTRTACPCLYMRYPLAASLYLCLWGSGVQCSEKEAGAQLGAHQDGELLSLPPQINSEPAILARRERGADRSGSSMWLEQLLISTFFLLISLGFRLTEALTSLSLEPSAADTARSNLRAKQQNYNQVLPPIPP